MQTQELIEFYANTLNSMIIKLNELPETEEIKQAKELLMVNFVFLKELLMIENIDGRNKLFLEIKDDISSIVNDFQEFMVNLIKS